MARNAILILLAVATAAVIGAVRAGAVVVPSKDAFGAAPANTPKNAPRSYFQFDVRPGHTASDILVVTNGSKHTEMLLIGRAIGATAVNSGYSYQSGFDTCRGAACWLHGIPPRVSVPAGKRRLIPFTVDVPAGAPPRQYLAGIVVRSAKTPKATSLGTKGNVGAQAVIIPRVEIGVAITTAPLATLTRRLEITQVSPSSSGATAALLIAERDTGETFVSARGRAVCLRGQKRFAYPVISQTILPGDDATLTVYTPGLPADATIRCRVAMDYGQGRGTTPAAWSGSVRVPSLRPPKVVETAPGVFSSVPKARVPRWAIYLMVGGGAIVLALIVVIVILLRRRPTAAA